MDHVRNDNIRAQAERHCGAGGQREKFGRNRYIEEQIGSMHQGKDQEEAKKAME